MRNLITIFICAVIVLLSLVSLGYPLTEQEKQQMIEASKNQNYDIVSKIMLKEYKENCKILKYDPSKSSFKSMEGMILLYSNGFTKLYMLNAKKHGYIFKTEKEIGMIKVRFIIELYDIYKST